MTWARTPYAALGGSVAALAASIGFAIGLPPSLPQAVAVLVFLLAAIVLIGLCLIRLARGVEWWVGVATALAFLALMVPGMVIVRAQRHGWPIPFWSVTLAVKLGILLVCLITWLTWRRLDEVQRESNKSSMAWGGGFGMVAALAVLWGASVLGFDIGDGWPELTKTGAMMIGALYMALAWMLGAQAALGLWWLRHR